MSTCGNDDKTVRRTPNPSCPAFQKKCRHTRQEFQEFHKEAGCGIDLIVDGVRKKQ